MRVGRPILSEEEVGKFVLLNLDIEAENFEVSPNFREALHRLLERRPDARTWLERLG